MPVDRRARCAGSAGVVAAEQHHTSVVVVVPLGTAAAAAIVAIAGASAAIDEVLAAGRVASVVGVVEIPWELALETS